MQELRCCNADTEPMAVHLTGLRARATASAEEWVETRTESGLALRWRRGAVQEELAVSCPDGVIFEADLRMIVDVVGRGMGLAVLRRRVQHHAIDITLAEAV